MEKEAVYVALAIQEDGQQQILVYWLLSVSESAENRREILQELRQCGVEEAEFIASDNLAGLKGIIAEVFTKDRYQHCVAHMMHHSSSTVRARGRGAILRHFKQDYRAIKFG